MSVTDAKTAFRATLIGSGALTALVPTARIYQPWYPAAATFPLIAFSLANIYNDDDDYFDDTAKSDHMVIEAHIFNSPNTSVQAIFSAMDTALKADGWNREYAADLQDPGNYIHTVTRYAKRSQLFL